MKEETGLVVRDLIFIREYETMRDGCKNFGKAFATCTNTEDIQIDGIEIKEAAWCPFDDLPADRVPRVDETVAIYTAMTPAQ